MVASVLSGALVLYPVVVHVCIIYKLPQYAVLYLTLLLVMLAFERVQGKAKYLLIILLPIIAVPVLYYEPISRSALYLFPVLVCLVFFKVFARTLVADKVPLVTRMAEITQGRLDDDVIRYTKSLTRVWALVFLGLAIESTLLAFFAPFEIWSLFTNIINYIIVALVFVADFLVRRRVLSSWRNQSFKQFMDSITKVKIRDFK